MAVEAFFGKDVHITLERKAASSTAEVHGEVTSFSISGGGKDISEISVFGGGTITKEERQSAIEVSFDVLPTDVSNWFEAIYGAKTTTSGTNVVTSAVTARDDYRITITAAEGFTGTPAVPNSGQALRYTFIGANGTTIEPSNDAGDEHKATITFKLMPTDQSGNAQIVVEDTANAATNPFLNPYGTNGTRVAFSSYT